MTQETYREPGTCGTCGEPMGHECPKNGSHPRMRWSSAFVIAGGLMFLVGGLYALGVAHDHNKPTHRYWAVGMVPTDDSVKRGVYVDENGGITIDGCQVTISVGIEMPADLHLVNGGTLMVDGAIKGPGAIIFGLKDGGS